MDAPKPLVSLEDLPPGPWIKDHQDHPREVYKFKSAGYRCAILKVPEFFVWNGYVTLPRDHPDYDADTDTLSEGTGVHGGFSYHYEGILGFDTLHYSNIVPAWLAQNLPQYEEAKYWTFDMVLREVQRIAHIFKARAMYPLEN